MFCRRAKMLALGILLAAILVPTAGADSYTLYPRLDPTLRRLVHEMELMPRSLAAEQEPSYVTVTVTLRAARDVSRDIAALGGRVNTIIGDESTILTARVPVDRLAALTRVSDVIAVSASASASPALDRSVLDIRANEVWALRDDGVPITGQGVLIGIVDTGIDWSHPDFKDARGGSRIVSIWDQTRPGSPPAGFDYGREWLRWQIEAGLATEVDTDGHGTHVAGVAAGAGAYYTGVAPGADLIIVKSPLDTASIIDAWNYIVNKARSMGRPVVINNSFGAHFGAHDGSADFERALDALSGPGVIFTTAAGNEGQTAMHASGWLSYRGTITLPFFFVEGYSRAFSDVNVWYEAVDSFSVSVQAPTGEVFGPVEKGEFKIFGAADGTEITVDAVSAPWPANGDNWLKVRLDAAAGEALHGDWSLTLHGDRVVDGRFDAWLPYGPYDRVFFGNYIDPSMTVREPATALQAISAGAYVTKECWTAQDGHGYCDVWTEGGVYPHSSRGPTRDGRPRPDVSAPGVRVFAARSANAPVAGPWYLPADDHYEGRLGTSVSTAHLTGVIALMLQVDPSLDPGTARRILRNTARQDHFTAIGSDRQWGAGKLDALAAVRAVQERTLKHRYIPLAIRNYRRPTPTPAPTVTPTRTPSGKPRPTPLVSNQ